MNLKAAIPFKAAILFTSLALGMALLYGLSVVLAARGSLPFAMRAFNLSMDGNSIPGILLWAILAGFGPAIAAILTAAYLQGREGLRELWRTVVRWRAPSWLYALVFLGPLGVGALITGVAHALHLLQFAPESVHPLRFAIYFLLMLVFDGPLGEEIGWRGLLLPQLLKQISPLSASLVVGVIWFLWHVPLRLADGRDLHLLGFLINMLATSVIFTWFYTKSGFSTFIIILLHTTSNFCLFLILRSFKHSGDISTLQTIYNVIVVALALAAAISLRRATSKESVNAVA